MTMDLNTIKTVSIIAIGVLVLIALLIAGIVRSIVTKLVLIAVIIVIAGVIWWQRDQLSTCVQDCTCTFFGQEVTLPDAIREQCQS